MLLTLVLSLDFGNANDTASNASTSISSCLAQLMATFAQIIGIGMYNNSASNNAVLAKKRNLVITDVNRSGSTTRSSYVAQVTQMTIAVSGCTMFLLVRIEMWSRRHAAICVIAKLMHMESV